MKLDRASLRAWVWFLITAFNIAIASIVTLIGNRSKQGRVPRIALSGHHFNGNLRIFYESQLQNQGWDIRYVYIDYSEYRKRRSETPGTALSSLRLDHAIWLAGADVFMTDHGPGIWRLLQLVRPRIPFVEVWHGVGYKALDRRISNQLARYAAVFAASEWDAKETFIAAAGLDTGAVKVTGYARTDPLVRAAQNDQVELAPTILMAPTWSHGDKTRTGLPFGLDERGSLETLNAWALENQATVVLRAHLNTRAATLRDLEAVRFRPSDQYPIAYELLEKATVLVTDWSSIAIDYLPLERPMVFLDVPAPFRSFRLDPEDRPGPRVGSLEDLLRRLDAALADPVGEMVPHATARYRAVQRAFGETLDGKSATRYASEIAALIETSAGRQT